MTRPEPSTDPSNHWRTPRPPAPPRPIAEDAMALLRVVVRRGTQVTPQQALDQLAAELRTVLRYVDAVTITVSERSGTSTCGTANGELTDDESIAGRIETTTYAMLCGTTGTIALTVEPGSRRHLEAVRRRMSELDVVLECALYAISATAILAALDHPAPPWSEGVATLGLTPQERRIVEHRMAGESYKEIASTFGISVNAVKRHMNNVYRKTGAHGHADLMAMCLRR